MSKSDIYKPVIMVGGVKYTACSPKMGQWRQLQQFRTERRERAEKLSAAWDALKSAETAGSDQLILALEKEVEVNRQFVAEGMERIILAAFPDLTNLDEMSLSDIPQTYELIKKWLDMLMEGRFATLPNGETPTEE